MRYPFCKIFEIKSRSLLQLFGVCFIRDLLQLLLELLYVFLAFYLRIVIFCLMGWWQLLTESFTHLQPVRSVSTVGRSTVVLGMGRISAWWCSSLLYYKVWDHLEVRWKRLLLNLNHLYTGSVQLIYTNFGSCSLVRPSTYYVVVDIFEGIYCVDHKALLLLHVNFRWIVFSMLLTVRVLLFIW